MMSWDWSLCKVTGYRLDDRASISVRDYFVNYQIDSGSHPISYSAVIRAPSLEIKRQTERDSDWSPLSVARSYTSTPHTASCRGD
jgi:hypothetical protein